MHILSLSVNIVQYLCYIYSGYIVYIFPPPATEVCLAQLSHTSTGLTLTRNIFEKYEGMSRDNLNILLNPIQVKNWLRHSERFVIEK